MKERRIWSLKRPASDRSLGANRVHDGYVKIKPVSCAEANLATRLRWEQQGFGYFSLTLKTFYKRTEWYEVLCGDDHHANDSSPSNLVRCIRRPLLWS